MKYALLGLSIILSISVQAQNTLSEEQSKALNRTLINREFAKVAGGGSESNLGQYASLSTDKNVLNLSVYLNSTRNLLKLNVSAGTKDGIASLFSNGEFNKNVTLGLDYTFWLTDRTRGAIDWLAKNSGLIKVAKDEAAAAKFEITAAATRDKAYAAAESKRQKAIQNIQGLTSDAQQTALATIEASYNQEVEKATFTYFNETNKKNTAVKKVKEALLDIPAYLIKGQFFKISGAVGYNDVNLFDGSLALAKQIDSERYIVPKIGVSYHLIRSPEKNRTREHARYNYFNFGADVSWDTNLAGLKKVTVRDTDEISESRSTYTETIAFQGAFKEGILTSKLYTEYYYFFDQSIPIGIHGIATQTMIDGLKPVSSLRLGTIFTLANKKKDKPAINFEVFYGINDLFKNQNERSLFRKNIIGIQTAFPIAFKN
ncbi:MAG: hypothetical protein ABNH00_10390 [Dokdonia sp.]|jgi:hypothetical protein